MPDPLPEVLNFDGITGVADATVRALQPLGTIKAYVNALPDIWHSSPMNAAVGLTVAGLGIAALGLGPEIASAAASAGHAVGL